MNLKQFFEKVPIIGVSWVTFGAMLLVILLVGSYLNGLGIIHVPALSLSVLGAANVPVTPGGAQGAVVGGKCVLSTTQTLNVTGYDADKPGTAVATPTISYYLDGSTGKPATGLPSSSPETKYDILITKANFASQYASTTTDCSASPSLPLSMKAIDTSLSMTVYNQDGVTANANTSTQAIGSGGTATLSVNMVQSASYKHIAGADNRFAVYVAGTNASEFDSSQMAVTWDGTACTALSQVSDVTQQTPSALSGSQAIYTAVCHGDFAGIDTLHKLGFRLTAASGVNPGTETLTVDIAPVNYYADTISGAVKMGAVKNDGSAIQALQSASVFIS